ncbi:uncharacterized protein [Glycine max]|uniref:uncharacterized protein isoform X2 n=1 Tax=Glycine max TaxID=3847 RepID=UPI0007190C2C|nr:uncharacterized protein LOC102668755 isoform X2 [Glycine max]|eukprot:XP_014629242.1 uncharacterized protein LOC102668755 isoform X2 [Glycine max]
MSLTVIAVGDWMMRPCRVLQLVSLHWWAYKEILLPKRNRRKKLNERLFVLGSVVPNISKQKDTDTVVKLCEVFESLKVKIVTANITSFSDRLLKTIFIEHVLHVVGVDDDGVSEQVDVDGHTNCRVFWTSFKSERLAR